MLEININLYICGEINIYGSGGTYPLFLRSSFHSSFFACFTFCLIHSGFSISPKWIFYPFSTNSPYTLLNTSTKHTESSLSRSTLLYLRCITISYIHTLIHFSVNPCTIIEKQLQECPEETTEEAVNEVKEPVNASSG